MRLNSNENYHMIDTTIYFKVFGLLLILTTATILQPIVFHTDLQNTYAIQMLISFTKVALVVAYYMHIKGSKPFYKRLVFGTTALLFSMYIIMAIDTYTRHTNSDIFK